MSKTRQRWTTDYHSDYATRADLCNALTDEINVLYLLAFLLTTNHVDAEHCVSSTADQVFKSNRIFKQWATSWIRRALIMSAITTVFNISNRDQRKPVQWFSEQNQLGLAVDAIIHLADLDRFVFVMSFLERHSVHECSLLLGVSPGKIIESRIRALRDLQTVAPVFDEFSSGSFSNIGLLGRCI